jgi:prepilin-type N-terminal cleavage/methylation domain-containing protein
MPFYKIFQGVNMRKKNQQKKRAVTLIEIMIVILLIGLISGALMFNMRGSLDKGRIFKTKQNSQRVYDALMMAYASGEFQLADVSKDDVVLAVLNQSPLIKNGAEALKDGWGDRFTLSIVDNDIKVTSSHVQ